MNFDQPRLNPKFSCPECWKEHSLCICGEITPRDTKTKVLILQHPQEVKNPLGTARLLSLSLNQSVHRIGMSWRSFAQAMKQPDAKFDLNEWAVLYVGTQKQGPGGKQPGLMVSGKKGELISLKKIKGIVLLDGNWKQSKTIWWRNPWFLKLNRAILTPRSPSAYGTIRRQPRKICLSTIESAAEVLHFLGEGPAVTDGLSSTLTSFLDRVRQPAPVARELSLPSEPAPAPSL